VEELSVLNRGLEWNGMIWVLVIVSPPRYDLIPYVTRWVGYMVVWEN
jgi:hypothetical protein